MLEPQSYVAGAWVPPDTAAREVLSPVTGAPMGRAGSAPPDPAHLLAHAHAAGAALRGMGFHDRARLLKALAQYLDARKDTLYALNPHTGATRKDGAFDIDGGIGTLFVFASKGRREMPDGDVYLDGGIEALSRGGSFLGQHIAVPKRGVAVQINAFNFPVWGMLEKLAPAILAGVPAIVKPATQTAFLTEACVRLIVESGLLPEGAVQLIVGSPGGLISALGPQDTVSFTGSAQTALTLRSMPELVASGAVFIAEQDSLNAAILGPDAAPGSAEFGLFISEAAREITTKAGQKCTAIRRMIVPEHHTGAVIEALSAKLAPLIPGDPAAEATRLGALVSPAQRADVVAQCGRLAGEAREVFRGDSGGFGEETGFLPPTLLHCADPDGARDVHRIEAFGPVATVMGYRDTSHAAELANRGGGSLVTSLFSADPAVARLITLESAAWHGRIYINNAESAREATGHGAPLPHMIHGGPGRAGGGEELGGVRGVLHYMQRTAVQGPPGMLTAITGQWVPGSAEDVKEPHPFRLHFEDIAIGHTLRTPAREVTLADIEQFAEFTGDTFYAHMDEAAAAANPFFPGRVAHGYLLLSFAAGLFVQPDPGPVLANTGLNALRFEQPVSPGDRLWVRLTAKRKTRRTEEYGEVAWHATLYNQGDARVAEYELLTMVAHAA